MPEITVQWVGGALMMGQGPGSNPFMGLLPILAMFGIMYFLLLRPQQKEARRHQEMVKNLKKGDEVVTAGGLFGRILSLSDERVSLRVDEGVKVEVERSKILRVVSRTGPAAEKSAVSQKAVPSGE
jgi:preprotein translocase subunit YajC